MSTEQTHSLARILGEDGAAIAGAMAEARQFLDSHSVGELLGRVGQHVESVPLFPTMGKGSLQKSYGGGQDEPTDDLLAGRGPFYVT